MKAIVWKIPEWRPGKFDSGLNVRIALKGLDGKSYHLNLVTSEPESLLRWCPNIREGNILDVNLQSNGKNVNRNQVYSIIKSTDGKRLILP